MKLYNRQNKNVGYSCNVSLANFFSWWGRGLFAVRIVLNVRMGGKCGGGSRVFSANIKSFLLRCLVQPQQPVPLGEAAVQTACPNCHEMITTVTTPVKGLLVWLVVGGFCIVGYSIIHRVHEKKQAKMFCYILHKTRTILIKFLT